MRRDIAGALRAIDRTGEASFKAEFVFNAALPLFAGHFPGNPLVPGVVQIEMVRFAAERFVGDGCSINAVVRAKFVRKLLPDEVAVVQSTVTQVDEGWRIKAAVTVGEHPAAAITLVLRAGSTGS